MYPDVPYTGYSWPLTQHMGVVNRETLYLLIETCLLYANEDNLIEKINQHLITNNVFSENVRSDSGKPDVWRDYQQILSELGLIYSTQIERQISLTPIGIAFLEKTLRFDELITLQLLRYQYPNGHKVTISPSLQEALGDKKYDSLTQLQALSGIFVRPGVLFWTIMYGLYKRGFEPILTTDEIQGFVMRCMTNDDAVICIDHIIKYREGKIQPELLERGRRNSQDWLKFASLSPLFIPEKRDKIKLSDYSILNATDIIQICNRLSEKTTFWFPSLANDHQDRFSWYSFFGTFDVSISLIPTHEESEESYEIMEEDTKLPNALRDVNLHDYDFNLPEGNTDNVSRKIISTYDYSKSITGHKLHDNMVDLIANTCVSKGANVYFDPNTVDLFVIHKTHEYLIEVKSITPKNFISRLRYALGQVLQYDYLLENKQPNRRLVLAFAASIPRDSWSISFINNHLDFDLLTIQDDRLNVYSNSSETISLFKVV